MAERDPEGFQILERYARTHKENGLRLLSRQDFLDVVLWPACKTETLIVAFNVPFDLSRLALEWSEAQDQYAGGFSLTLWHLRNRQPGKSPENRYRPRLRIKHIDNKRALMGFSRPGKKSEKVRARLLDLKTLTYVLTDKSHSLKSACEAFQTAHRKLDAEHDRITPVYIDYNRNDVQLLHELLEELRAEFDLHPIDVDPCKAMSPAAIGKGYLSAMGITAPREKFQDLPKEALAIPMLAYYGGRAECRVRMEAVPVVHCDTRSMYPTVYLLMNLFQILSAEKLYFVEATAEVQQFLEDVTLADCLDPKTGSKLNFFAVARADSDVVPTRASYTDGSDAFTIGLVPLTASVPIPYAGPDLVDSKIRTGRTPRIEKAYRLVPEGIEEGLRPVRLRGVVEIDPRNQNPFQRLVEYRTSIQKDSQISAEDRKRLDLSCKVVANSTAYGINAELKRIELPKSKSEVITFMA